LARYQYNTFFHFQLDFLHDSAFFSTQKDFSPLNQILLQYQATICSSALERFRLSCVTCVHLRPLKINISFLRAEDMQKRVVHSRLSPPCPCPSAAPGCSLESYGRCRSSARTPALPTHAQPPHHTPAVATSKILTTSVRVFWTVAHLTEIHWRITLLTSVLEGNLQ
jgi:hypothetical protein